MKEPTQEQIKEFWEWCGFKESKTVGIWWYPAGGASRDGLLPIDLNNLFKYAAPRLLKKNKHEARMMLVHWITAIVLGEDPALALFWAIYKVVKGKANDINREDS